MSAQNINTAEPVPASASIAKVEKTAMPQLRSRRVAADVVGIVDVLAIAAGGTIPALIYQRVSGLQADWVLIVQSCIAASIIGHICLKSWGMYDTKRMHNFPQNPERVLASLGIALLLVVGLGLPKAIANTHLWLWYGVWGTASYTLLLINRIVAHNILKKMTLDGAFNERIAVFGAGTIARRVHDFLADPNLAIHFVGVFDDRAGDDRITLEGLKVAGELDDLISASRNDEIDQIIVALPQQANSRIHDIIKKLEQLPVSVHIVTHISSDLVGNENNIHNVSNIGSVGLLDVKNKPLSDWGPIVKRAEDLVLGWLFLAFTLPLYPIIALAIKLESNGPVFFFQRRRGLNGEEIDVIKFRTMTVTENGDDVKQATKNDPRVTKVGALLRRLSIDEIPQLWNVIKGDMSLVGPRPHAIAHDNEYSALIEKYVNRHQVKPGITGLAQVNGFRGETETTDKIQGRVSYDIKYIENWSFALDMKILGRTFFIVILGNNAH